MIKGNVTIKGAISRAAAVRQSKDGKQFVSFAVNVVIPARQGINKTVEIQVTQDGATSPALGLAVGTRVEVAGSLTLKKRDENMYYNLYADSVKVSSEADDSITGTMEFRGKVGKTVEEKTDKKGRKFVSFSAFHTDKVQTQGEGEDGATDTFEYIWVRFIFYSDDSLPYLQPKAKIEVKGTFELSMFNDMLSISCMASEVSEYVPKD